MVGHHFFFCFYLQSIYHRAYAHTHEYHMVYHSRRQTNTMELLQHIIISVTRHSERLCMDYSSIDGFHS